MGNISFFNGMLRIYVNKAYFIITKCSLKIIF